MTAGKHFLRAIMVTSMLGIGLVAGACDHTDLEGTISPSPVEINVGEEAVISLEVPSELEGIHREMWHVEPEYLGVIESISEGDKCREVAFTAKSPGTGVIGVMGFYKQTNPQFIAETAVIISE